MPYFLPSQTANKVFGQAEHDSTCTETRDGQDSATDKESLEISPFYACVFQASGFRFRSIGSHMEVWDVFELESCFAP